MCYLIVEFELVCFGLVLTFWSLGVGGLVGWIVRRDNGMDGWSRLGIGLYFRLAWY